MKSSNNINLVYLVRHGSTEWNEKQLWQGTVDTELSEKGIKEVENVAEYFSKNNIKIDLIYASPMKRALETALIISEKIGYEKDKIIIDERLRECEIVLWNGKNINEVKKDHYNEFKKWQSHLDTNIKGVESLRNVQKRMYEFLKENSVQFANKNVIIVSHAIALRMLIAKILKLKPPNHLSFSLDNASITALQLDYINYNNKNEIRIKFLNLNPLEIVC